MATSISTPVLAALVTVPRILQEGLRVQAASFPRHQKGEASSSYDQKRASPQPGVSPSPHLRFQVPREPLHEHRAFSHTYPHTGQTEQVVARLPLCSDVKNVFWSYPPPPSPAWIVTVMWGRNTSHLPLISPFRNSARGGLWCPPSS